MTLIIELNPEEEARIATVAAARGMEAAAYAKKAIFQAVVPGEEIMVTIAKEGAEGNQGIAYIDDVMIIIEGGNGRVGESLSVVATSVLHTVAGTMVFASMPLVY